MNNPDPREQAGRVIEIARLRGKMEIATARSQLELARLMADPAATPEQIRRAEALHLCQADEAAAVVRVTDATLALGRRIGKRRELLAKIEDGRREMKAAEAEREAMVARLAADPHPADVPCIQAKIRAIGIRQGAARDRTTRWLEEVARCSRELAAFSEAAGVESRAILEALEIRRAARMLPFKAEPQS